MKINIGFYDILNQDERDIHLKDSIKNLELLRSKTVGKNLYILGNNQSFSNNILKVGNNPLFICNDAINYVEKIKSELLILSFTDPMFHFSGHESADNFLKIVKEKDHIIDYFIVPQTAVPILNHLGINSPIIGVSSKTFKRDYQIDLNNFITTKKTHNVMTQYMIPLASYLSKNIFVGSITLGSKLKKNDLWKYDKKLVDQNEKLFAFDYSFFKDRNFKKYYEMHNKHLENILNSNHNIHKL